MQNSDDSIVFDFAKSRTFSPMRPSKLQSQQSGNPFGNLIIEPSIGDFGLLDYQETQGHETPRDSVASSLDLSRQMSNRHLSLEDYIQASMISYNDLD